MEATSVANRNENQYSLASEELADRVIREFGIVMGTRGVWESHWQEIAERIWPSMSWQFNPYWYTTPGQKRTWFIFDSTATLALGRFGAILDSLLTPRNSTWHSLQANDASLMKKREIRLYFEAVSKALFYYRYLPNGNFASQNQQNFKSLGGFGTGGMFIDELANHYGVRKGIRYRSMSLGELYICENHQGIVDKVFRYFELTARQAFQKWGNKLPDQILGILEQQPDTIFHFIHLVEPRTEDFDPHRKDAKGKPFASYYVCREGAKLLEESGYQTFPYAISRYEQFPREVYGRSPAMDLLPAIKTLNEQKKAMLKQGQRTVDPIYLMHDDGVLDGFSAKPGAMNAGGVTSDGRPLVHTLPVGNVQAGKELMDDERSLINDGFLVSLFQILTESPQMTATEVLERTREKGILLAPTIGRQQSEYLGPMIEREIDILSQQGLLPPMPDSLKEAKGEFKIIYDSPLTRAAKSDEASGVMRTVENCLQVAQVTQDPSILFHFNWDKIVPAIAEIQGVPLHWMNTMDAVQKMKQQHAQMQQQQQMTNAAPGAAAIMSSTAKMKAAGVGGGSGK